MQQPITRREVYEPSLTARIAGREVELESASMDRMLPDPVSGGSLTAASGELVTVEGPDTVEHVATPWDPGTQWPPVPETAATVQMDTGSGPVNLLTNGRVMSASGGTGDRAIGVEVADQYQSLDRTISWDAVARHMPSPEEGEYGRYVSMFTTSIVDMILRHCGWHSTPALPNFTMLSVPAQGTMWPERGYVEACGGMTGGAYPSWPHSSWGRSVSNVDATYRLAGGGYSLASRGAIEMMAMTQSSGTSESMYMLARAEDWSSRIGMQWNDTNAYVTITGSDGQGQTAAWIRRDDGFLYSTVRYLSSTRVEVTIRSGGRSATETVTVPAEVTSGALLVGRIWGQGQGGGFVIAAPSSWQVGAMSGWVPNAVLYPRSASGNHLVVRDSAEGVNCSDFLQQICEVEAATYWIDETGVLRWWDLARLESQSLVATLNSNDDIEEAGFTWSHSLSAVKHRVSVKWQEPLVTRSWSTSVDLWQGNGQTAQPGTTEDDSWINVPDDEIWIMPDTTMSRAPGAGSLTEFNRGIGSWYGGRLDRGDGIDTWVQNGPGSFLMSFERVTDRAFKMGIQWTGSVPVIQKTISMDGGGSTWSARRDLDLPIIRGKAKIMLSERMNYSAQTGPATSPEFAIDAGWLIQDDVQAQWTADYYGARTTIPQPVLSSVALIPIPGLQLGDMVEVRDEHVTRLTIRGLVVEDSRSINADMEMTHAVAIRPLYVTRNRVTWEEWGTAMAGRTWETWGTQQQPKTWEQWGHDPLAGEED